jgi:UDP-N-acetylglucosamine 2-epimerase (non-hydrolysing)/GDP/UDP-N,N'-diacetylbacillosamine 2-epimerase (hydrolysing)
MTTRRIAVITGSRAEYGALRWLLRELRDDPRLSLQLIVTGAHLAPEFGFTVREIESDGFEIAERIECQLSSDSPAGMAKSLAVGMLSMPDALHRLRPHLLIVVGDRYEILASVQAAALMGIPIAHISGGEVTEGAVDDWIRHSITKASWWHFAAAEPYCKRIIQLGESPDRVFNVGDLALDSMRHLKLLEREALERELGMSLQAPVFLVTYHPATLGEMPPGQSFRRVLAALEQFPDARVVITKPNADAGGRELGALGEQWSSQQGERSRCFASLGQVRYLSVMKLASAVIGNTSSGVIEAPALKVPTVNIGPRQSGRLKASSIVDCDETTEAAVAAISKVLSPQFRQTLPGTRSLYGEGTAGVLIKDFLAVAALPKSLAKPFHDL